MHRGAQVPSLSPVSRIELDGRIAESGTSTILTDIETLQGRDELWSTVISGNTRFADTDLRLGMGFCKHDLAPSGRVQTLHRYRLLQLNK